MKYDKPPLSFEEQAGLLVKRGLVVDSAFLIDRLKNVNYYRLSGYLYPYRQAKDNDSFKLGTTFEKVWRHYTFDRRLRLIVMDAIERVEVSIRTQLICILAHESGAFGYTKQEILPNLGTEDYLKVTGDVPQSDTLSFDHIVSNALRIK